MSTFPGNGKTQKNENANDNIITYPDGVHVTTGPSQYCLLYLQKKARFVFRHFPVYPFRIMQMLHPADKDERM